MTHYYLESSALVKLYVAETGSNWLLEFLKPELDHTFYAARISAVEVVAALLLRVRTGSLSLSLVQQTIEVFKTEFYVYYQIAEITASLVERAMKLVEIHPLKGYDAVQLAAAITLNQA